MVGESGGVGGSRVESFLIAVFLYLRTDVVRRPLFLELFLAVCGS